MQTMKPLMITMLAALLSCTSQPSADQQATKNAHSHEDTVATAPLNSGTKWKADEATRRNVAAMVQVVADTAYANAANSRQLYQNLQAKVDVLVKECSMKGADHDALHVWLEKVLKDMKEIKEGEDDYPKAYEALKKDVNSFYESFE